MSDWVKGGWGGAACQEGIIEVEGGVGIIGVEGGVGFVVARRKSREGNDQFYFLGKYFIQNVHILVHILRI